ncbi:uncharacterized protein LOC141851885 [Brevipalpus obovatus]|uniref:uncharacterized protein LOC141851885 n=1 Tax=Brevipalpus obovatus TaxID=246614 RepID=UPI003D9E7E89
MSVLARYRSLCDLRNNNGNSGCSTQIPKLQARKKTSSIGRLAASRPDISQTVATDLRHDRSTSSRSLSMLHKRRSGDSYERIAASAININGNTSHHRPNYGLTKSVSTTTRKGFMRDGNEAEYTSLQERYIPNVDSYKQLMRENLQLQASFKVILQRVQNDKEKLTADDKEKKLLKDQLDHLKEKIDLMALELDSSREQKELMEFKFLELEQSQSKLPLPSSSSPSSSSSASSSSPSMATSSSPSITTVQDKAIQSGLPYRQDISSTAINIAHNNANNGHRNSFHHHHSDHHHSISKHHHSAIKSKNCSSLESYTLTLSLTSEDEGLGDDGRRDQFSGPSSLSDLHLSSDEESGKADDNSNDDSHHPNSSTSSSSAASSSSSSRSTHSSESPISDLNPFTASNRDGKSQNGNDNGQESNICIKCQERSSMAQQEIEILLKERESLREQVLELEEAENDARLVSQQLKRQVDNLCNQVECLQITLAKANQQIDENNELIQSLREEELKLKVDFMMALISKHEESPGNFLEDLKAKLKEKRRELDQLHPLFNHHHHHHHSLPSNNQSSCSSPYHSNERISDHHHFRSLQRTSSSSSSASLSTPSHHSDANDCEIFVPEDSLPPNMGSSFHVKNVENRLKRSRTTLSPSSLTGCKSIGTNDTVNRSTPMPICETVKPKKIDLMAPDMSNDS